VSSCDYKLDGRGTYASEHFNVVLVLINGEDLVDEVVDAGVEQQAVGHVALITDGQPELEVLDLLLQRLIVDVDAALEADFIDLPLAELVNVVETERLVLFPQPGKVHVQLADQELLGDEADDGPVQRNFETDNAKNIIDNVEASDWRETHKMSNVHQVTRGEELELGVGAENRFILEEVRGHEMRLFQICFELAEHRHVGVVDVGGGFEGIKILRQALDELVGGVGPALLDLEEFLCRGVLGYELRWNRVREDHEEWWQQNFGAWNQDEKAERYKFDDVLAYLSYLLGLEVLLVPVLVRKVLTFQLGGNLDVPT
jgi:hypothetical protein